MLYNVIILALLSLNFKDYRFIAITVYRYKV